MEASNVSDAEAAGVGWYRVQLIDAVVRDADLQEADMRGASVEGTDFQGSNLTHANFQYFGQCPNETCNSAAWEPDDAG